MERSVGMEKQDMNFITILLAKQNMFMEPCKKQRLSKPLS